MSTYIRYEIKNIEPLRIANDYESQTGQVKTLKYIPGTAIQGLVVNSLKNDFDFEAIKKSLLSDRVRFLNAYIEENGHELIPSPKGFYEDKVKKNGKKEIENVVISGDMTPGYKRAGLGNFCYFENDTVFYYTVGCGSDLKIKVNLEENEKQNVFRNDYIAPGYSFVGYICIDDGTLTERIKSCFSEYIYVGNARSQGLGKCRLLSITESSSIPYSDYTVCNSVQDFCYMMLLSDTVMLGEDGEPDGINETELATKLGVPNIKISRCSTSVVEINGYNRKLAAKTPSIIAYEKGSVFRIEFPGASVSKEAVEKIQNEGIGMLKNVGMGRICFVRDYENISFKVPCKAYTEEYFGNDHFDTDSDVLHLVAKNFYRQQVLRAVIKSTLPDNDRFSSLNLNSSQIGNVEEIILKNKYDMRSAKMTLNKFWNHNIEKEENHKKHDNKQSIKGLMEFVYYVLENPLKEIFDIELKNSDTVFSFPVDELLSSDETDRIKMDYILKRIRMKNRKEVK